MSIIESGLYTHNLSFDNADCYNLDNMLRVRDLSLAGNKRVRKTFLASSIVLFMFLYGIVGIDSPFATETVLAQENVFELRGYAHAANVGWISFNCKDGGDCADSNYKVSYDSTTKTFSGFAWSGGIGWIKFGDLEDIPHSGVNMYMDDADAVHGWIRACAGTINGDCTDMTDHPDGWDGWINVSGTSPDYGPVLNDENKLIGYSWGSEVVAWINWSPEVPNCPTCGVRIDAPFEFDFVQPFNLSINQGETGSRDLVANLTSGLPEGVTFTYDELPQGITVVSLDPVDCELSCVSEITVSVDEGVSGGGHPIVITATPQSAIEAQSKTLNIVVPPIHLTGVTCSANRASGFVEQDIEWTATVTGNGGPYTYAWSGDVTGDTETVTTQYQDPGTKYVEVVVTDTTTTARDTCPTDIVISNRTSYEFY
jgi:hypothetical protein